MRNKIQLQPLAVVIAAITLASSSAFAAETRFIKPPMVSIPAGVFAMGSEDGPDNEKPVRQVAVPAFQMGKYNVTIAEFRKFIDATGYNMPNQCTHRLNESLGFLNGEGERDGSWDNNSQALSEFHPVVCLSRTDAINYTKWLSAETGKHYRLPTEAEWEYTVRAGTTTRYFFGDEEDSHQACDYANVMDLFASKRSSSQPCYDKEVIASTVGIYKPNPFGVHDLIGNVAEYLADCYQESYQGAPRDGSALIQKDCQRYVVRGGSWQFKAFSSSQRHAVPDNDWVGALEGFRLALDTRGKALPSQTGDKVFLKNLAIAQANVQALHKSIADYPQAPRGLKVTKSESNQLTLSWNKNVEDFVSGYRVYRQEPLTNTEVVLANDVKTPFFVDPSALAYNARYSVAALNGKSESVASAKVDSGTFVSHLVPVKIQGEAFSQAVGADVRNSGLEPEDDRIIVSLGANKAVYHLQVTKAGKFQFDARVFHSGETQKFELWLNDKRIANPELAGERGWQTVDNIIVDVPQGSHTLIVKGEQPMFAVNWLDVKAVL
ncbi:SUMF1/EgtB/PvdO family nonheme iron enzyme [Arsukibacterium ikkense]|uniref:SUMF1/EgtB/PvdO family nonheme iron enzyme n=1 Tax=Arsukibacterium ikkense TaxID=336831 RepID=UPI00069ADA7E|nr:SUMF1/EgtB/PvdO family nonheme iron enzyme [Arsukibacterium ikkense]